MLSDHQRAFLDKLPVAHLATADVRAVPHVVPVCYVVVGASLYISIDQKPKRVGGRPLKRVRNILENPSVVVTADRYDHDWSQLGWVMMKGTAEILKDGNEHDQAQEHLRQRYPQYERMQLAALPVIAVRITSVIEWGQLA
ncbi:MAG: TIGR03668 family PPOX class F420-dependent oxidoreductase [Hyphomicrobiaceae bacterium]